MCLSRRVSMSTQTRHTDVQNVHNSQTKKAAHSLLNKKLYIDEMAAEMDDFLQEKRLK